MGSIMAEAEVEAAAPRPWEVQAAAPRPWEVQATEVREKEKVMSLIEKKFRDFCMELSGMSDAEREAKQDEVKEERAGLIREFLRVASEIKMPDYSGMSEAERMAEAERLRQEELEEARRRKLEGDSYGSVQERQARVLDFDPKQGGMYYNRLYYFVTPSFDHDEETPFGPMRLTHKVYENGMPDTCEGVNVLSVKIACSDVGFPIQVYGSVIARDSIDYRCVYLFRRDRDHCQLISSKDEPLILTGPKRGLVLSTDNYIETDLKIKDHHGQDRELSKGILTISGIASRPWDKCEVETRSIATRLSTVDVLYAVVSTAVEGTIATRVLQGEFYGTITAHTTSIQNRIVLYDSKVNGANTSNGHGIIPLMRPVVCVYVKGMLIIEVKATNGESVCLEFTPRANGRKRVLTTVGATRLRVRVAWSIMEA